MALEMLRTTDEERAEAERRRELIGASAYATKVKKSEE